MFSSGITSVLFARPHLIAMPSGMYSSACLAILPLIGQRRRMSDVPGGKNLACTRTRPSLEFSQMALGVIPMPSYEFLCQSCKKQFSKTLTPNEYEEGEVICLIAGVRTWSRVGSRCTP